MNKKFIRFTAVSLVGLGMLIGVVGVNKDDKNFNIAKNLDIYYTLFRELNLFYVDEIDPGKLVKTGIDEMLQTLDPYTTYIPETEIEDFKFMTTGEYGGIGAMIAKRKDKVIVSEPYEGFPAQKSGLRAGDIFLEVAGKDAKNLPVSDVSDLLKGPANEVVKLKMQRPGAKKPYSINIVREKIHLDAVPYFGMVDDKTGYIRFTNFTMNCSEEVKRAFIDLRDNQGAERMILDLRGNPGGLLNEAVSVVNLFVNKGQEVVSTKGKVSQWDKTYKAMQQPLDTIMPLAVLVSRGSASASEIVSGAIQDLDRGIVIGKRTFGKGLVQTTRDLSYNAKLKVTTAKYYIPSGRCIQALDYSHRNEDGSVGTIPDSLISEFSTKNGRKVFDGGGVTPDVKIDHDAYSHVAINLMADYLVFDYATQFTNEHETIAPIGEFNLSDQEFEKFIAFAKEKDFSYESGTERKLKDLLERAKKEKYYEGAEEEFTALEEALSHDVEKDMRQFKDEIVDLIENELVTRYYYQKGSIKNNLIEDKDVLKAKELFNNPTEYNALLQPQ